MTMMTKNKMHNQTIWITEFALTSRRRPLKTLTKSQRSIPALNLKINSKNVSHYSFRPFERTLQSQLKTGD